jgi:uncharacterized protein YecE (DUF72 family)
LEVYVGTSGWYYPWNEGGSLDWYVAHSGLNAIELNSSFYRFPYPNVVNSWARKGRDLRWSVKVNRLITHTLKFSDRAVEVWERFHSLFKPLDHITDFYLFQLPPSTSPRSCGLIEGFIERTELNGRFALEARNIEWYEAEWAEWASSLGITLVSVDSPEFPLEVYNTSGSVYLRMHGRTEWYSHHYSDEELREVMKRIFNSKPDKAFIFFNNDHDMLVNSRKMLELSKGLGAAGRI